LECPQYINPFYAENAKTFAKKQYDIIQTIQQWNAVFDKTISIKKKTRIWGVGSKDSKKSPSILYIESLGEYARPLREYVLAQNEEQRKKAMEAIKVLFDSNPMFYSKSKGSVLQYMSFFPEDKVLREWTRFIIIHTRSAA
jgi:hypothetical protein